MTKTSAKTKPRGGVGGMVGGPGEQAERELAPDVRIPPHETEGSWSIGERETTRDDAASRPAAKTARATKPAKAKTTDTTKTTKTTKTATKKPKE